MIFCVSFVRKYLRRALAPPLRREILFKVFDIVCDGLSMSDSFFTQLIMWASCLTALNLMPPPVIYLHINYVPFSCLGFTVFS